MNFLHVLLLNPLLFSIQFHFLIFHSDGCSNSMISSGSSWVDVPTTGCRICQFWMSAWQPTSQLFGIALCRLCLTLFRFFCGLLLVNSHFKEMVCFRSVQVRTIDADMHQWIEYSVFQRALSLYSFYSTCTTLWPRITYRHGKSLLLQLYVQWLAWVLCKQSYQGVLINKFLLNLNSLHLIQRSSTCGT